MLGQLSLDGEHRVERGHWILEDHRNIASADPAEILWFEVD